MKILIVEDDTLLLQGLILAAQTEGYACDGVSTARMAEQSLEAGHYSLVVLDLGLPDEDGLHFLARIRQKKYTLPVLILTARDTLTDKIAGLDVGADDYLVKPFHLDELKARIRSLTRRRFIQNDVCLVCGRLRFDTKARKAFAEDREIVLTRKENGILEYLMLNEGRPVSQEEFMEHVWDGSVDNFSNSIRVHMSSLRKKLKAVLGYDPIRNRIGEGYQIGGEES